jgi:DNA polymerase I-like protein with 3'-5' exonuclease and polymerase domains
MIKTRNGKLAFKMDVPLDVEIGVGENWLGALEI